MTGNQFSEPTRIISLRPSSSATSFSKVQLSLHARLSCLQRAIKSPKQTSPRLPRHHCMAKSPNMRFNLSLVALQHEPVMKYWQRLTDWLRRPAFDHHLMIRSCACDRIGAVLGVRKRQHLIEVNSPLKSSNGTTARRRMGSQKSKLKENSNGRFCGGGNRGRRKRPKS